MYACMCVLVLIYYPATFPCCDISMTSISNNSFPD